MELISLVSLLEIPGQCLGLGSLSQVASIQGVWTLQKAVQTSRTEAGGRAAAGLLKPICLAPSLLFY